MKKLVASPPLSATPSPQSSVMLVFVAGLMPELRVNFSSGSPARLTVAMWKASLPKEFSAYARVSGTDTLMLYSESWQLQHVKVLASEQNNHYIC